MEYFEKNKKKNEVILSEINRKNEEMLREKGNKWKFMTAIKIEQSMIKDNNLYETQQISLRV